MPEKPTPEQPKETPGKEPEVTARKLVPNDMILGEQGEPLTVKKIAGGRTLRFEVEDETGGKTILGESQVNKLLKKQKELIESEKTGSGEKSASNTSETSAPNPAEPSSPPAPGVTETKTEEGVTKPEPPPNPEPTAKPEGSPTPLPKDAPLPTPGKKPAAAKEKPAEAETGGKEPVRIGNWTEIDRHFPEAAGTLRQLMHPANASIPKFLGIIGKFNEAHQKPVGLVNRKWRRLSNGRTLTFRWDGQGGQQIVCTLTPDEEKRTKTERGVAEKGTAPEASDTPTPPTSEPTLEAAPAEPEPTTTTDPEATTEEPAPEAGTEAAPETPEPPKTPEEVLEQVYGSNPDFKEAVEALKNPDLSAADFVSKLTEFNTRTPLKGSPQEVRYELPSGRVVIAMWDSEGNVGIGGQLAEKEKFPFEIGQLVRIKRSDDTIDEGWEVIGPNNANGETRVVVVKRIKRKHYQLELPVAELLELNPPSGVTPEPPAPEEKPKPLEIPEGLLEVLKEARDAYARDIAHNRKTEGSLKAYEVIKKEILRELKQNIEDRGTGGEEITFKIFEELVALTLTNEALELSIAIRSQKETMDQRWSKRATRWWLSDSVRKIRLGVSWALLGIGAAGVSSGVGAGAGAAALGLRALIGAAGMAEVVQRFYEIGHNERLNQAHKDIARMGDQELYSHLATAVLSEQAGGSITQNQIEAIEREASDRITKETIAKIESSLTVDAINELFTKIEENLTVVAQEIQTEQKRIAGRERVVRFVGISAAAVLGIAGAGGAFGGVMPDFARTAARVGGGLGGSWLGRTVGRWLGVRLKKSARAELYGGILGAIGGGAAVGVLTPSDSMHAAETATTHEQTAIPQPSHEQAIPPADTEHGAPTPSTSEAHPGPAPDARPPEAEVTPGAQPEALGTTPPVISETTVPGQPEATTSPAEIKFEGAPELQGTVESGGATWAELQIDKEGIAHNVGMDLSGDGVADKNVDIKIDDFKTGHGTLTGDVLNDKGEVVYEKGTVVQVWDKDWNETASGDAGLVARVNVMKDLDGDGKFETQVGYDKNGDLQWTHKDSVHAQWDKGDALDFKTTDGHLDNFAKGTDAFGFQGFEVTGETPQEIAHDLADQWAALSGQATPSAELVAQFESAVTSHPELVEAHNTDHLWTKEDIQKLNIETKPAETASPTETSSTISEKYNSVITSEHMQKAILSPDLKDRISELLTKNTEFKGLDGTSQEALRTAFGSTVNENITVYARLGAGDTPEKYFIHVKMPDGTERAGLITP